MNRGDRVEAPLVNEDGELVATDWDHALERASQIIAGSGGGAVALASSGASNEALILVKRVLSELEFRGAFGVSRTDGEVPLAGVEGLALRGERAPNATGARMIGFEEDLAAALKAVEGASVVLVLDEVLDGVPEKDIGRAENLIFLGTTLPEWARAASVVLPIANVAEEDGSFVNRDHRVQRYLQAKAPPGMARPAWWVLGELAAQLGSGTSLSGAAKAFELLAAEGGAFSGLSYERLGYDGVVVSQQEPAEVST